MAPILWYLCLMGFRFFLKRLRSTGMTIGTVLLLVTVGSLAVFTMVAMAFFHMRFSNVVVNQRSARNIAESALSTALTKVWESDKYGVTRDTTDTIHITSTTDEAAEGFLAFNEADASRLGVPYSTNNFESEKAVEGGNGRTVPDSTVHLVAVGKCRGAQYKAEILYYVPPYPNALASSGPVVSTGGLLVAGIPTLEKAASMGPSGIKVDKLEPGHILSNAKGKKAIYLGPDSSVRGDVVAVGSIEVVNPVDIQGEVRPNASPQTVPNLNVNDVFTRLNDIETRDKVMSSTVADGHIVDYFTEASAPLTVKGDLVLDGGVLYCRDDLNIQGKVTGNGAIFSLGDVKIDGGADLSAKDQVAVVAKGSLELHGTSKDTQFFNGLIYSESEILASDITIIGAAVVNGDDKSQLELDNVTLVKTPLAVSMVIGTPMKPSFDAAVLKSDNKKSKIGLTGILGSTKKSYSYSPPDTESTLKSTLAGGLQISGFQMPKADGEVKYSLLYEGVFSRGIGGLKTIGDLTPDEQTALELDTRRHYFAGDNLYVRYDRLTGVNRAEAQSAYNTLKGQLESVLGEPVNYTIVEKKKKRVLFFSSTKTKKTPAVFDPAEGLVLDIDEFLDTLKEPRSKKGPTFIDLNLNQVFDPAETSKILLWKSF